MTPRARARVPLHFWCGIVAVLGGCVVPFLPPEGLPRPRGAVFKAEEIRLRSGGWNIVAVAQRSARIGSVTWAAATSLPCQGGLPAHVVDPDRPLEETTPLEVRPDQRVRLGFPPASPWPSERGGTVLDVRILESGRPRCERVPVTVEEPEKVWTDRGHWVASSHVDVAVAQTVPDRPIQIANWGAQMNLGFGPALGPHRIELEAWLGNVGCRTGCPRESRLLMLGGALSGTIRIWQGPQHALLLSGAYALVSFGDINPTFSAHGPRVALALGRTPRRFTGIKLDSRNGFAGLELFGQILSPRDASAGLTWFAGIGFVMHALVL